MFLSYHNVWNDNKPERKFELPHEEISRYWVWDYPRDTRAASMMKVPYSTVIITGTESITRWPKHRAHLTNSRTIFMGKLRPQKCFFERQPAATSSQAYEQRVSCRIYRGWTNICIQAQKYSFQTCNKDAKTCDSPGSIQSQIVDELWGSQLLHTLGSISLGTK